MFETPEQMAKEYMRYLATQYERDTYIEERIEESKAEAVKRLYMICDPSFAEAIASTIALSFMNDLPEAIKIVDQLRLTDKHLAALNNDTEEMCRLILEEVAENEHYAYGA